jgi:hypothetical protein
MKKLSNEAEEVVVRTKRRVEGVECDICKRLITPPNNYSWSKSRYFKVTTGHHDWGNDSCDSVEHRDICPDCIMDFTSKYISNVDGTDYLEIETTYAYKNEYEYD